MGRREGPAGSNVSAGGGPEGRHGSAAMETAAAEQQQHLRSLRDFLLAYNRLTELCFQRCACDLNYRALTGQEEACLEGCAGKLVRSNHRLMAAYVRLMPALVQRRLSDFEAAAAAAAPDAPPRLPLPAPPGP
ncbi:mitochondrial import inner membrane translocase subunit Tim10 B [Eublepharis macularius]|uniref:Mitochondrial import inner membrane translocase subunit n=1 Tax=Eublepharis macularius TaxID=481883 RepID=A0AA97J1Q3_EUBMA|nr:mitochondrial import inner membrane translocase subunit Tim10 B [Eublepharis macularius]